MVESEGRFNIIYEQAVNDASYLEPWSGHYLTRKVETEILTKRFNFKQDYIGLELGCGNAFQSALLAALSKRIFATDLPGEDKYTHSLGIKKAQDFVNRLNIRNITIVSCTATALPFENNYFDFVFSSSVLEHIRDRKLALLEMKRVLKPGGYLILIVPTHMPSVYAFLHTFLYILARVKKIIGDRTVRKNNRDKQSSARRFKINHPSFPLPEPHGAYSNIFKELFEQFPSRWSVLIKGCGLKIIDNFSTCIIPWLLIEPFSTRIAAQLYRNSRDMHYGILGKLSFLGYLNCFIFKND